MNWLLLRAKFQNIFESAFWFSIIHSHTHKYTHTHSISLSYNSFNCRYPTEQKRKDERIYCTPTNHYMVLYTRILCMYICVLRPKSTCRRHFLHFHPHPTPYPQPDTYEHTPKVIFALDNWRDNWHKLSISCIYI